MLTIRKLLWDTWNVSHIARHHIIPDEVHEVCHQKPIVQRGKIRNRLVLLGPTKESRLLTIVLENRGAGNYYPITAYDASIGDEELYERLRGGEDKL